MTTDIATRSFWDKITFLKPYALLARWDRPVGMWLTLWPALWSVALAPSFATLPFQNKIILLLLFLIGAIAMRGAGCTINDITDRKLDAQVARTKARPLASGQLSLSRAVIFLVMQLCLGALVLFQLSPLAIIFGIACLPLIALYPWMKRITWWPQAFLGLVFNMGALIAWAAMENSLGLVPFLIYASGFFWTMGYDTVYAHLDSADDALAGIKSTALRWGPESKIWVFWFWIFCLAFFGAALWLSPAHWMGWISFVFAAFAMLVGHLSWDPVNSGYSLALFRLQAKIGLLLALAAFAPLVF